MDNEQSWEDQVNDLTDELADAKERIAELEEDNKSMVGQLDDAYAALKDIKEAIKYIKL